VSVFQGRGTPAVKIPKFSAGNGPKGSVYSRKASTSLGRTEHPERCLDGEDRLAPAGRRRAGGSPRGKHASVERRSTVWLGGTVSVGAGRTTAEGRWPAMTDPSGEGARNANTAAPQPRRAAPSPFAARLASEAGGRAAEDGRLALRASRGEVEAFDRLVQDHWTLVYRVSLSMLGRDGAEDASQEVWVRVWRNIQDFRGESAVGTWLYRITMNTMNTCVSIKQKEARHEKRRHGAEMSHFAQPSDGDADPETAALNAERREEIHVALRHVRAEHRAALVLRHMEGLSYAEIAEVLGVPNGTAKGWASRGRAKMRVALVEEYGGHGRTKRAPDSIGPPSKLGVHGGANEEERKAHG